ETKQQVVVGVNQFQATDAPPEGLLRVDERVEKLQRERLKELRASRNQEQAQRTVRELRDAAKKEGENLIPFIYAAVKAEATLGELSDAMREVFGDQRENVGL